MTLYGKCALVTGGSRGVGRAIAIRLAQCGADVAITYATQSAAAADVVQRIVAVGRRSFAVRTDVSKAGDLRDLFATVDARWCGLDIYVNNAIDVAAYGPLMRVKLDAWRHTVDSHIGTLLGATQLAVPLMRNRDASIVALSSLGSRVCLPNYGAVGVAKAALEALVRYLAVELGPLGIRVNALSAGPLDTDALRSSRDFDDVRRGCESQLPVRRMGNPTDVAGVAAFLCSADAAWICGQTIVADGGLSLLGVRAVPSTGLDA